MSVSARRAGPWLSQAEHGSRSLSRAKRKGPCEWPRDDVRAIDRTHQLQIYLGGMTTTTTSTASPQTPDPGAKAGQLSLFDTIQHVRDFHDAFRIGNATAPIGDISGKDAQLRYTLMREENEEYLEAANRGDLVEVADALGDMLYILCGTILKHGLQHKIADVFVEIQRSNMSKLDGKGQPIYREDGKVLKSDRYFRPDIGSVLEG